MEFAAVGRSRFLFCFNREGEKWGDDGTMCDVRADRSLPVSLLFLIGREEIYMSRIGYTLHCPPFVPRPASP